MDSIEDSLKTAQQHNDLTSPLSSDNSSFNIKY